MNRLNDLFLALAHDDRASTITKADLTHALEESFPADRRGRLQPHAFGPIAPPPAVLPGIDWHSGAYHPRDTDQVRQIVAFARAQGRRVRVAGAQHSATSAIYSSDDRDLRVVLEGTLRAIAFNSRDEHGAVVTVGGGCYLGVNPSDPSSNLKNSLSAVLDEQGYALPILGGISHQTVAGFLQTSSAGGSTSRGFAQAITSIELVDGTGVVRWLDAGSEAFDAACVSMGLFGIVTRVVLAVGPRYFVKGTETNHAQADSVLVKRNGRYLLSETLERAEYFHLNWFPQRQVRRVTQWTGMQATPTTPPDPYTSDLKSGFMNAVAAFILAVTSGALAIDPDGPIAEKIVGALLRMFIPLDKKETFNDRWFTVLPCDDQARVDTLIKVIFTEIWLPLEQLGEAVDRLQTILGNQGVAGNFLIELYGAEKSPFWLSPSFDRDVVRVDVFWWAYNFGDPRQHFTHFWRALLELDGARLHWGKHLPDVGETYGSVVFDRDLLTARYSRLPEWLQMRQSMDPDSIFVTGYWRHIFRL